jgi:site-specific recombinase XerD
MLLVRSMNEPLDSRIITISRATAAFLKSVSQARSLNTARTYKNALQSFKDMLRSRKIDPDSLEITKLSEDSIAWMAGYLKDHAPTTERLYLTAVARFFDYLVAENLASVNLPRIRLLIQQRARRPGIRLPQFPKDAIEKVLDYVVDRIRSTSDDENDHLRDLRDRAFLITLADTGLRVHEACNLRRGDIDWNEGRALVIGKGDRQAVVRFSKRCQLALKDYLTARSSLDGSSGKPLGSLPLFARHDKGAGKKIKGITPTTGRNIVAERVKESLGPEAVGTITPHSFRHYFVTRVLQASGNLKLAQELARHRNIAVTQRYAHLSDNELDKGYFEIFEDTENN